MIAKCLQNLANLVEFGAKESYMEVVNPFILKNKERMVVFLDHLSVSQVKIDESEESNHATPLISERKREALSRRGKSQRRPSP